MARQLIERDGELSALGDALAAAREGTGALVLLEGGAGIGKTALLAVAQAAADAAGMGRLGARAAELERDHAFGVVRQLVEPLLRELDDEGRSDLLSGAAAHAAPAVGLGEPDARSSDFAILNGLYWLLIDLAASRPLALFVDDAHWADEPSLRFIAFLAPRLPGLRLAVIVATREGEEGMQAALIDEIRADPISSRVRPAPLSQAGVTQLLGEQLGTHADVEFGRACRRVTDGNPFYLGCR